ncbi:MAG TPA: hypothetical protein VKA94_01315 [Hyphomicrobiales bacterium]|nr:hypothetical protein [Hyphomicrobiales bacterium]
MRRFLGHTVIIGSERLGGKTEQETAMFSSKSKTSLVLHRAIGVKGFSKIAYTGISMHAANGLQRNNMKCPKCISEISE